MQPENGALACILLRYGELALSPNGTTEFDKAMTEKTTDSRWIQSEKVTHEERIALLRQQPVTLWLTGLSASGKSTLAYSLERELVMADRACYVLDGDHVRHGLSSDLGFTADDRAENIRRVAEVARLMNDAGLIVIAALISPLRVDRALAKKIIGEAYFREVHVSTSLAICESRDPKGLYRRARSGRVAEFTGISSPYEPPEYPALQIDTERIPVEQALLQLLTLASPGAT